LGLPVGESEDLLDLLWAHAAQPSFTYIHKWRVGDLVVWDNRCAMHRRDGFDPNSRRLLHRAQVKGNAPIPLVALPA
jgi:taurine dioxygenase